MILVTSSNYFQKKRKKSSQNAWKYVSTVLITQEMQESPLNINHSQVSTTQLTDLNYIVHFVDAPFLLKYHLSIPTAESKRGTKKTQIINYL